MCCVTLVEYTWAFICLNLQNRHIVDRFSCRCHMNHRLRVQDIFTTTILSFPGPNSEALLMCAGHLLQVLTSSALCSLAPPIHHLSTFCRVQRKWKHLLGNEFLFHTSDSWQESIWEAWWHFTPVLHPCGWLPQGHAYCSVFFLTSDIPCGLLLREMSVPGWYW